MGIKNALAGIVAAVGMLSSGFTPMPPRREKNRPAAQRAGRRKKAISMATQKRAAKKRRNKLSRGR
jgi:hypothetical protein